MFPIGIPPSSITHSQLPAMPFMLASHDLTYIHDIIVIFRSVLVFLRIFGCRIILDIVLGLAIVFFLFVRWHI
ncbi:hypothetical protein F5Y03DRAFT_380692, partial [Xylaria venustula]